MKVFDILFLYFFKKFVSARNKIGEGGYGTVFKGRWKHQEVAIKRIRKKQGASEEDLNKAIKQLFKEIWTLSCFRFTKFTGWKVMWIILILGVSTLFPSSHSVLRHSVELQSLQLFTRCGEVVKNGPFRSFLPLLMGLFKYRAYSRLICKL